MSGFRYLAPYWTCSLKMYNNCAFVNTIIVFLSMLVHYYIIIRRHRWPNGSTRGRSMRKSRVRFPAANLRTIFSKLVQGWVFWVVPPERVPLLCYSFDSDNFLVLAYFNVGFYLIFTTLRLTCTKNKLNMPFLQLRLIKHIRRTTNEFVKGNGCAIGSNTNSK